MIYTKRIIRWYMAPGYSMRNCRRIDPIRTCQVPMSITQTNRTMGDPFAIVVGRRRKPHRGALFIATRTPSNVPQTPSGWPERGSTSQHNPCFTRVTHSLVHCSFINSNPQSALRWVGGDVPTQVAVQLRIGGFRGAQAHPGRARLNRQRGLASQPHRHLRLFRSVLGGGVPDRNGR